MILYKKGSGYFDTYTSISRIIFVGVSMSLVFIYFLYIHQINAKIVILNGDLNTFSLKQIYPLISNSQPNGELRTHWV